VAPVTGGEELRGLLRRLPHGVAVVTVDAAGQRVGLTVTAFVSLSLEPPLVGVAISRFVALHELLREAGGFAVSLLAVGQDGLAQHFARGVPPIALWAGIDVTEGRRGPLLDGALGWIECSLTAEHATGDHTLFVGGVETVRQGSPRSSPLLHADQEYGA